MHNVGNIGIDANFEFPYISSFLLHLYHMLLVNVKIDTSGKKRDYISRSQISLDFHIFSVSSTARFRLFFCILRGAITVSAQF